jgi:hypothetical protein
MAHGLVWPFLMEVLAQTVGRTPPTKDIVWFREDLSTEGAVQAPFADSEDGLLVLPGEIPLVLPGAVVNLRGAMTALGIGREVRQHTWIMMAVSVSSCPRTTRSGKPREIVIQSSGTCLTLTLPEETGAGKMYGYFPLKREEPGRARPCHSLASVL